MGTHCVLVADRNTYKVAGESVEHALTASGITVTRCLIEREGDMEPNEQACGEVLLSVEPETEFLIAVGSGSITDTVRVNARRCGLPFVSVGTAPSMDGYTSVIAPLLLKGAKIHRAGPCPEIIVCDTDVLRTAPDAMIASGVGDVLGKYIAKADWKLGRIINDEPYCEICGEIVTDAIEKLMDNVKEIKKKTEKGIRILIEGLLLAGVTILISGETRAVGSVEHNITHYWEMQQLKRVRKEPPHGASVGVATLMLWPLYMRFADEDLSSLDMERIRARRMGREARKAWVIKAYGSTMAEIILRENPEDFLTWEEQERRVRRAQARMGEIRQVLAELPSFDRVVAAMRILGAPMCAADVGVGEEVRNMAMHCGKDYRSRYSLMKLIDECGLEEKYLSAYPVAGQ